ncbi:galactokinase [Marasmius sp. AFHP31]|nr:galactokinase [Marasmius sp. AFHP31]
MSSQQPIPVYTNLNELYGELGTTLNHAQRWNELAENFQKKFGRKPAYIVRAPGRVNLIGEHIDYCLFGVLPAAIEQDILIACAPRAVPTSPQDETHEPGHVTAENAHTKYARQMFAPSQKRRGSVTEGQVNIEEWHLDINKKELRWESYVKAGYYGVLNNYFNGDLNTLPVPVDLLVTGAVPAGSGLSSSAAMVVASTLTFLAVNGKLDANLTETDDSKKISKGELVTMAVANEYRVGVNSGGMDQAASVISIPSAALYISFFPKLDASPAPLPPGAVFVCANSLVVSDKAVTAKTNYNLRVVETLAAARILARHLNLPIGKDEKLQLREVVGRLVGEVKEEGEMSTEKLIETLKRMDGEIEVLKPAKESADGQLGVTMEEMVEKTGLTKEEFHQLYLSWVEVEATHFQLYKRAKHVFSEALRVLQFRQVCLDASASPSSSSLEVIEKLGNLMNESQKSCNELFQCSCPELNQLTTLAREAGAYGSRLTGAGWGGCTVSIVAEDKVDAFIKQVSETYPLYKGLSGNALREAIFATKPSSGACGFAVSPNFSTPILQATSSFSPHLSHYSSSSMVLFRNISAWITTEQGRLNEYRVIKDTSGEVPIVSCWIPSTAEKNFTVHLQASESKKKTELLAGYLRLDGKSCGCLVLRGGNVVTKDRVRLTLKESYLFNFEDILLTDDDKYRGKSRPGLGGIRIIVQPVKSFENTHTGFVDKRYSGITKKRPVHSADKKGLMHVVGFAKEGSQTPKHRKRKPIRAQSVNPVKGASPIVEFVFRYAPYEKLRADGIVRPTAKVKGKQAVIALATKDSNSEDESESSDSESDSGSEDSDSKMAPASESE